MRLAPRIMADKGIRFGKPTIEGTRVPIDLVLGKLGRGMTYEEVMREYAIEREDILAVLNYASKHLAEEEIRAMD
jgi:uncharacterized protein (DUF433 family)